MGLFVSEALVNSIKHAHRIDESGTICVSCRRSERGSLLIEIIDDGVGLPSSFRACPKSGTGTGARLMLGIAHDLGAYLTFEKSNPGQIVRLEVPALADQDPAIVVHGGRSRGGSNGLVAQPPLAESEFDSDQSPVNGLSLLELD
jgi:hypothetical protein